MRLSAQITLWPLDDTPQPTLPAAVPFTSAWPLHHRLWRSQVSIQLLLQLHWNLGFRLLDFLVDDILHLFLSKSDLGHTEAHYHI